MPVVQIECILGGTPAREPARLVTVRTGERLVACAVDDVLGVKAIARADLTELPPLCDATRAEVSLLGVLDAELVVVLNTGRLIPPALWETVDAGEGV
jgi:purine-binding chemotaxis protein CheW